MCAARFCLGTFGAFASQHELLVSTRAADQLGFAALAEHQPTPQLNV